MGTIMPAPIVRWQKWAPEWTAYIRVTLFTAAQVMRERTMARGLAAARGVIFVEPETLEEVAELCRTLRQSLFVRARALVPLGLPSWLHSPSCIRRASLIVVALTPASLAACVFDIAGGEYSPPRL